MTTREERRGRRDLRLDEDVLRADRDVVGVDRERATTCVGLRFEIK